MANTERLFVGNSARTGHHLSPRAVISENDDGRSSQSSQPATSDKLQSANSYIIIIIP